MCLFQGGFKCACLIGALFLLGMYAIYYYVEYIHPDIKSKND